MSAGSCEQNLFKIKFPAEEFLRSPGKFPVTCNLTVFKYFFDVVYLPASEAWPVKGYDPVFRHSSIRLRRLNKNLRLLFVQCNL